MKPIPFNKPYIQGRELLYIAQSVASGKISGDGLFTEKCHRYIQDRYGFQKVLLTTSCTDALEMAALLLDIKEGDEVIVPAFTFVSSANAFALRGARIIFADSSKDHPNIAYDEIESLITSRTRVIVVVHYAGVACEMDEILQCASLHGITVVEDAAQAIDATYKGRPLGSLGDLSAFSFHETKNIISGEGGMICINNSKYSGRAEIIREKGTNRTQFFRGEIDKYGWVDLGSSFLPSDIIAAYLLAQLEILDIIQARRVAIWQRYYRRLSGMESLGIQLPQATKFSSNNGHMFYIVAADVKHRAAIIDSLRAKGIHAVFHYLSLHSSPYFADKHDGRPLVNSDRFADSLMRLPLYYELTDTEVDYICDTLISTLENLAIKSH